MTKVVTVIGFVALTLLALFLWVERNHWLQLYVLQSEAHRICSEYVGPERKCMLVAQDGGIEGQTYIFKDSARRVLHFKVGTVQVFPIFATRDVWAKEDFQVLQCDDKGGKCIPAD